MAAKSRGTMPNQPKIKTFASLEEIEAGKGKLKRRLAEVRAIDPTVVDHESQAVRNVEDNISKTILEVFGPDSPEYIANRHFGFFRNASIAFSSDEEAHDYFAERGLQDGVDLLENLIRRLDEEAVELTTDTRARVRSAFDGLDLHPRIADVCVGLYHDGHYTDAVLKAALALENYVKDRSGRQDLSGSTLMEQVFSPNSPVLAVNPLADQSDKDEQRGLMLLFQGSVFAFRNPRAHKILQDSPQQALEAIALLSLLAKRLEQAKRMKS